MMVAANMSRFVMGPPEQLRVEEQCVKEFWVVVFCMVVSPFFSSGKFPDVPQRELEQIF
jgi:hypothetical protein